ncbi:transposase-like protein [Arthrobacter sp. MP_M7]|nr:transposase-like protein [Arthrobacter sp. MP_M4]MEC5203895.1 transposase-like protein [Arthrobacter sp. MP_M7]
MPLAWSFPRAVRQHRWPELGISVTALKRWVQLHRDGESGPGGRPDDPVDPAKYEALEARLREVERENDFLKKVSAFFAEEQR